MNLHRDKELCTFTCQRCSKDFKVMANPERPFLYCPNCRRLRNNETMRLNAQRTGRLVGVPDNGKSPFEVISHPSPDGNGLPAGSHFPGQQMMQMVRLGYIEGAIIRTQGQTFKVEKRKLVPA